MEIKEIYNYAYTDKFEIEDINERRLYINSEIDSEVIDQIVYHIMRYNRLDGELSSNERKPIILYINSPGGSVCDGYGWIDRLYTIISYSCLHCKPGISCIHGISYIPCRT